MPIYEYRCENCGTVIEKMQRMADAPLVHCDACGHDALKKLISATSFVLKGSGWYATDYKARPVEGGAKGAASEAGKGESGEAGKAGDNGKSESAGKPAEAAAPAPKAESAPKA